MTKHWQPDRAAAQPMYEQIIEYIKEKINSGEWTIGTAIPSQRKLAALFNVNRSTVVYALEELIADGVLEAKVGKGTFVASHTWQSLATFSPPDWVTYINTGIYQPNIEMIRTINETEFNPAIIRLGTGELSPEFIPQDQIKASLAIPDRIELDLGYSEPKGNYQLRKTISDWVAKKGILASPDSILIVSGALQALQLIAIGLLKQNSAIFQAEASYLNSIHVFQSAGMKMFGVPTDHEGIIPESLAKMMKLHQASLLYTVPSFDNPTGILMPETRRKQLLATCRQLSLPLIEDDVYSDLWLDESPPKPLKAIDRQGDVLYINSISKTLSPGLRVGWVIGPEPVIDRLADIKMQTDYGSSSLSQYIVNEWISTGQYQAHLITIREKLQKRREFALKILDSYFSDLAIWTVPKGGFYIWLELKVQLSMHTLFQLALKQHILLNPGLIYQKQNQRHIRLSYGYASMADLESGLIRLAQLIIKLS
ncbi:aminotransferase-like domain-containing protein [Amphibacillus sediminis]|uniref:aminotransferase-like domain-containing protein n=1 Tax=Amphibacillus sediminis TaxID=360185 RepID=UPI00082FBEE6|nr:PLP-dependent aminotransferase family protein [Amphibacillus sediminis]